MENLSSAISVQVDSYDKELANSILKKLGLNMSTYVNMAIKQLINKDGIPFDVVNPRPNRDLLEALQEGEDILSGRIDAKRYHSIKEMIEDLENEL